MNGQTLILGAAVAAALVAARPGYSDANPSDETAKVDAGGTLQVTGNLTDEHIALRLKAGDKNTIQVDFGDDGTAEFSFARADVTAIDLEARAGDDVVRVDDSNGDVEGSTPTTIDGGHGNDTITGGSGDETLLGDTDDDTFIWNPGGGNDTIDGGDDADTLEFDGGGAAENIDLSKNGSGLGVSRDVGGVALDATGVESVDLAPGGGADTVTVDDLSGTDVTGVTVDEGTADAAADDVVVNGTASGDTIDVGGDAYGPVISGLAVPVTVLDAEPTDRLTVNGLGDSDTISAAAIVHGMNVTLNGGDGADTLTGGGFFNTISGGPGRDTVLLDAAASTFEWAAGDGSDTIDSTRGINTLQVEGSDTAERFELAANGSRLSLTRDVGNVTLDAAGIDYVDLDANAGADTITVDDLTGTGVSELITDLGAADGKNDQMVVNATSGTDIVSVSGNWKSVGLIGLVAGMSILDAEPGDTLTLNGRDGDDTMYANLLAANTLSLVLNGGDGQDTILGSPGDDVINGGPKTDVLTGGGGSDTITQ